MMLRAAVRRNMPRELRSLPYPLPPMSAMRVRIGRLGETFDDGPRVLFEAVRSYVNACHYLILSLIREEFRGLD